jgi:transcriptional regulator with PAS, ATPase and Fis domain
VLYLKLKKTYQETVHIQKKEIESLSSALNTSKENLRHLLQHNQDEQFARQLISHLDQAIVYVDEQKIVQYINLCIQLLPNNVKLVHLLKTAFILIRILSKLNQSSLML